MEASEPKWVNPIFNIIGVNSLRLGGLQIHLFFSLSGSENDKDWLVWFSLINVRLSDY